MGIDTWMEGEIHESIHNWLFSEEYTGTNFN